MKKAAFISIPARRTLRKLGSDIRDARRRRRIPVALLAERASISRFAVGKIEKGDPTTSIGRYVAVLYALGMLDRLADVVDARHDVTGRQLVDEQLPQRIRISSRK